MYIKFWKPLFDFCGALLLLLLFWPLLLLLAVLVRVKLGSPVLFRQERPGYKGKIFKLYKFRSMTDERDASGNLAPDERRLTRFGKLLRSTSLDELPELINILRGEMSFVGPRPLLVQYLPLYSDFQRRRHDVRPGLTGWAQVNGRNAISWQEKFRFDVEYVDRISLKLDLKIMFMTAGKVLNRSGISQEGNATMEAFKGDSD